MCAPFIDQEFEFTQPDGTKLKVKGSGNAYRAEFETLDGFTVTRNPETGYFDYGIEADGVDSVKSSGVPLGSSVPTGIRVSKGLKKRASGFDGVYALSGDIRPGGRRCDQRRNQKKQFSDFGSFALDSVAAPTAAPPQRQTVGRFVGLTLLIDFSDQMRTMTEAQVEQFLNAPGYSAFGNNGSVRDYFQSVSRGRLDYSNIVAPWYQASKKLKYYADRGAPYGERAREFHEPVSQHRA